MKETSGRRYAYLVLGLIVMTILVMDFNERMSQLHHLTAEKELVMAYLIEQMETQVELKNAIEFAKSDAAVEKWAYEDAHKAREGDYRIVPISIMKSTPTPAPRPLASA